MCKGNVSQMRSTKMCPPFISAYTKSPAEKRLFEILARLQWEDQVYCLHSVHLPEHARKATAEADFVIIGPRGLLVLEVKGGRVSHFEGKWMFGRDQTPKESPFRQAETAMYALLELLSKRAGVAETFLQQRRFGYGFGVVFTDITFDAVSAEIAPETIIDQRTLSDAAWRDALEHLMRYWSRKRVGTGKLTAEQTGRLYDLIRPEFEKVPSLFSRSHQIEESVARLTEAQLHGLDMIDSQPRLFLEGGAGTGKTLLAVEMARRDAARGKRVLLVCWNPYLAARLSAIVSELPQRQLIKVSTMHEVLTKLAGPLKLPPTLLPGAKDPTDINYLKALIIPFENKARGMADANKFDVLIIDEAQDLLQVDYLLSLGMVIRGGIEAGEWRIFGDPYNQGAIYGASEPDTLDYVLANATYRPPPLRRNCRNTDPIVQSACALTGARWGAENAGPGPDVKPFYFSDMASQRIQILKILDHLQREGVPAEEVILLSACDYTDSILPHLGQTAYGQPVPVTLTTAIGGATGKLRTTGVREFKGLESRFVVVTDITDVTGSAKAAALLYVGITRARAGVWLGFHEELRNEVTELKQKYKVAMRKG